MENNKLYKRFTSKFQETKENTQERKLFEETIIDQFIEMYKTPSNLNVKIPRTVFEGILDDIGFRLREYSKETAQNKDSELHKYLEANPMPKMVDDLMLAGETIDEFRIFCLTLNSLKQWLSAEQAATDRFLLGGEVHKKIRKKIKYCIVTGEELKYDENGAVDFHHTMRDGRFPIPLTAHGHDKIEFEHQSQNHNVPNEIESQIELFPACEIDFKNQLLISKKVDIEVYYTNGDVKTKKWNASKMTPESDLMGNIRSRSEFRKGIWTKENGISTVKFIVRGRDNLIQ
jgi:hypothetical protein